MRAIAVSPRTAPLVGIDVARYSALAFATGGALAAVAGILLSSFVGINPTIGAAFTMKALIVVVMGGIGHVLGGLVAGLILGLAETMAALLLDPGLITVINFAIFSIVLLWRPQGLFGGSARSGASAASHSQGGRLRRGARGPALGAALRQRLLALAGRQHPHLRGARDGLGLLLRRHALRLAGGLRLLRHRRLCGRHPRARLLLRARAAGRRRHLDRALRLRRPRHAAPLRHVLRDLHLRPRHAGERHRDLVGVQHRPEGRPAPVPVDHDHAHLLPAARPVRRHHRPVARARPQPHGLRAQDARRRRDGGAPGRHQHRRAQDRHLRRQLRGHDARRRHPRPALVLHGRHRRLQSQHLVPHRHHGAARRRHLGVGADAGRHAAGADLRLPLGRVRQLLQRRAGPGAARHRVLHPQRPDRPAAVGPDAARRATASPTCSRPRRRACGPSRHSATPALDRARGRTAPSRLPRPVAAAPDEDRKAHP